MWWKEEEVEKTRSVEPKRFRLAALRVETQRSYEFWRKGGASAGSKGGGGAGIGRRVRDDTKKGSGARLLPNGSPRLGWPRISSGGTGELQTPGADAPATAPGCVRGAHGGDGDAALVLAEHVAAAAQLLPAAGAHIVVQRLASQHEVPFVPHLVLALGLPAGERRLCVHRDGREQLVAQRQPAGQQQPEGGQARRQCRWPGVGHLLLACRSSPRW
eukprot:scaffold19649_cov104-Isochrysis_galbana.AAC.1